MLMSQSQFAKSIGRSRNYINTLVHKGVIPTYEGKKVKSQEAKECIEAYKDPKRDAQREANAKRRKGLLDVVGSYSSLADMDENERKLYDEKQKELASLKREADELGIKEDIPDDISKLSIKELNILILKQDLRIKTVKADESEKEVIRIDEVKHKIFQASRIVRDGFLSIPARLAARLAAESVAHACKIMLEQEIQIQLENLQGSFDEL